MEHGEVGAQACIEPIRLEGDFKVEAGNCAHLIVARIGVDVGVSLAWLDAKTRKHVPGNLSDKRIASG